MNSFLPVPCPPTQPPTTHRMGAPQCAARDHGWVPDGSQYPWGEGAKRPVGRTSRIPGPGGAGGGAEDGGGDGGSPALGSPP